MGFFNFSQDELALSRQGWVYLACTFPLTFLVVGGSFAWIWWTGKKEEKPANYSTGHAFARVADTFSPWAGPRKDAV